MISRPSASFPLVFQIRPTGVIRWHGPASLSKPRAAQASRGRHRPRAAQAAARSRSSPAPRGAAYTVLTHAPCECAAAGARRGRQAGGGMVEAGNHDVSQVPWDILIVLLIVLIGGFFAAAEMVRGSLREGQVRAISQRGKRGQRAARLAQDPQRFLSSVQIGVTLATLVSGVYGSATLAGLLKAAFIRDGMSPSLASPLSFGIVTIGIT